MAALQQKMEIEIGGTKYVGAMSLDAVEAVEDTLNMGAMEILRHAAVPTLKTKHAVAILARTLYRDEAALDGKKPIGEAAAKALVARVGYFDAIAAVLNVWGQIFKKEDEAA